MRKLLRCSFVSIGTLIVLSGCSATSSLNTFETEVRVSDPGVIDAETARRSTVFHQFLVGELKTKRDDLDGAIESLELSADAASGESEARVRARLAELRVRSSDLEAALGEIDRSIEINGNDKEYLLLKADILESLERFEEAEPLYVQLLSDEEYKEQARILLSNLYIRWSRPESAIQLLEETLIENPDFESGYLFLSQVYEQMGEVEKARIALNRALTRNPFNEQALGELIAVNLRSGKPNLKELKRLAARLVETNNSSVLGRRVLSELALEERDFNQALEHLHVLEAVQQDPSEIRLKIALVSIEQGQLANAEQQLALVIASNPENSRARFYLASIFAEQGRGAEAIEQLAEIGEDSRIYERAQVLRSILLRQEKRYDEAIRVMQELVESSPDELRYQLTLASLLQDAERFSEAVESLEKLLEDDGDNVVILFRLGTALHGRGAVQKSEDIMRRILELDPNHTDAMNYLAYSLAERGSELEVAEELIRKALEQKPKDGYYLDTLGWILFKRGEYESSYEVLKQALALVDDDLVILHHFIEAAARLGKVNQAVKLITQFKEASDGRDLTKDERQSAKRVSELELEVSPSQ